MIAAGALDATIVKPNSHDWDLAAVELILRECGGALVDLAGQRAALRHGQSRAWRAGCGGRSGWSDLLHAANMPLRPCRRPWRHNTNGQSNGFRRCKVSENAKGKQLLHLVFGGELTSLKGSEFRDLSALDIVGIFPTTHRRRRPGRPRRRRPWTMRICATTSCTCTGCSTPDKAMRASAFGG